MDYYVGPKSSALADVGELEQLLTFDLTPSYEYPVSSRPLFCHIFYISEIKQNENRCLE